MLQKHDLKKRKREGAYKWNKFQARKKESGAIALDVTEPARRRVRSVRGVRGVEKLRIDTAKGLVYY